MILLLRIRVSSSASLILAFIFFSSMLENSHRPFCEETCKNPFGSSPTHSVFFSTNTNPLSWYKSERGSPCFSESVVLNCMMSPTFSLNVSRATSRRRWRLALTAYTRALTAARPPLTGPASSFKLSAIRSPISAKRLSESIS